MAGAYTQASANLDGVASLDSSYEASTISSTSTSQSSVFSSDDVSEQSSVSSSTSDDFRSIQEDGKDRFYIAAGDAIANDYTQHPQIASLESARKTQPQPTYASVTCIPTEQRQHPRRSSLARNQKPPPLVRQVERKLNFVDNLVDSATQMVEVIWPLSMINCRVESSGNRGVLPLRTYIEETLRRSRTSYSTLQVALYYLVLIKPYVPSTEPSADSGADYQANRVLVCGRRMFLAALILASKYLQDRNYSAKAWSKMSGLKVTEINANERIFLDKINWKLHVAKPIFDRWVEVVLKYTPSAQPPSSPSAGVPPLCWKSLVPVLTPDLNGIHLPDKTMTDAPEAPSAAFLSPATPTPTTEGCKMNMDIASEETTPTPASIAPPRFLEPRPNLLPPTPGLVRMGPLPTPQMTPASVAASTPAASVCNSRRPSICNAMSFAQRSGMNRCITDEFPFPLMDKLRSCARRTSVSSLASARSSPESMITDLSRSSRASSISSVAATSTTSAYSAPRRSCLARLATIRNVKSSLRASEEIDGTASRPITIAEEDDEPRHSPPDFSVNERKLHTPHRHSKHAPTHTVANHHDHHHNEKSRKRHRQSRGGRKSDLYDEVRYQLEDEQDDKMVIDLVDSDEDMTSPSPAIDQASSFLRGAETAIHAKAYQPPSTLSRNSSGRIPLSRFDGSKRTCYSAEITNNTDFDANASVYMEIA